MLRLFAPFKFFVSGLFRLPIFLPKMPTKGHLHSWFWRLDDAYSSVPHARGLRLLIAIVPQHNTHLLRGYFSTFHTGHLLHSQTVSLWYSDRRHVLFDRLTSEFFKSGFRVVFVQKYSQDPSLPAPFRQEYIISSKEFAPTPDHFTTAHDLLNWFQELVCLLSSCQPFFLLVWPHTECSSRGAGRLPRRVCFYLHQRKWCRWRWRGNLVDLHWCLVTLKYDATLFDPCSDTKHRSMYSDYVHDMVIR